MLCCRHVFRCNLRTVFGKQINLFLFNLVYKLVCYICNVSIHLPFCVCNTHFTILIDSVNIHFHICPSILHNYFIFLAILVIILIITIIFLKLNTQTRFMNCLLTQTKYFSYIKKHIKQFDKNIALQ